MIKEWTTSTSKVTTSHLPKEKKMNERGGSAKTEKERKAQHLLASTLDMDAIYVSGGHVSSRARVRHRITLHDVMMASMSLGL